ncbi:MAG: RadC family protein [Pseudobdellovibrionaceae bacterium]
MIEITNAFDAYSVLKEHMTSDVEEVWVLALNSSLRLIEIKMIFRGTVDSCLIHPRDVFRFACMTNASQIVVAHNHPSGDLSPSNEDIKITKQLIIASRMIEIPILDHLILTSTHYCSMAHQGFISSPRHPKQKGLRDF